MYILYTLNINTKLLPSFLVLGCEPRFILKFTSFCNFFFNLFYLIFSFLVVNSTDLSFTVHTISSCLLPTVRQFITFLMAVTKTNFFKKEDFCCLFVWLFVLVCSVFSQFEGVNHRMEVSRQTGVSVTGNRGQWMLGFQLHFFSIYYRTTAHRRVILRWVFSTSINPT